MRQPRPSHPLLVPTAGQMDCTYPPGAHNSAAMSHQGKDIQNHRILLSRFISSRQWDRALETAREWLAAEPENPRAHFAAGQSLINLKRYPEAEPHLAKTLASEPENATAHRFMSIVLFHRQRFKAADEAIQKALSLDPNDAYNWYHLAWMLYKHGRLVLARTYAEKARALAPRDSDIVNLLALCTPKNEESNWLRRRQYEEALALEPENSQVHNNLGVYYLESEKDYAQAEACFRRALFFDPALQVSRANLFITLKHRDTVYRVLCAPRDFICQVLGLARRHRLLYFVTLPLWLIAIRFLLGGLALWFLLVWPTLKVYEYLTIGDIRAQAGELGARRGGFLGYRRWPLRTRLAIFILVLVVFWGGLAGLAWRDPAHASVVLGLAIAAGLLIWLALWLRAKWKQGFFKYRPRHSTRRMEKLLQSRVPPDR